MYACQESDLNLVKILLCHNANVNLKDSLGRNALFYAILSASEGNDNYDLISFLIKNEINVNEVDQEGFSPLILACTKGLKNIIGLLVESAADVDQKHPKDGSTPLHIAVIQNRSDIILLLLNKKPNLTIQNKSSKTAMDIATESSRTEIYSILAEEFNQRDKTVSHSNSNNVIFNNSRSLSNNNSHNNLFDNEETPNNTVLDDNFFIEAPKTQKPNFSANNTQNININISSNFQNYHSFNNKFTKNAKLQKLQYLKEKRQFESNNKIKDKVFKFPFGNLNSNTTNTNIEIPFSFNSTNLVDKNNTSSNAANKVKNNNPLHTFISKYIFI